MMKHRFDAYDNKDEVIAAEKELQTVFPKESLTSFTTSGYTCITAGATVVEKGNTKEIKQLKALGWRKGRRQLKEIDYKNVGYVVPILKDLR